MNKVRCEVCGKDAANKNDTGQWLTWECAHVECPNRRSAWSERAEPYAEPEGPVFNPYERLLPEGKT